MPAAVPTRVGAVPPRTSVSREPNTAVNLGALIRPTRDDPRAPRVPLLPRAQPIAPLRPKMDTLVFHGAPPLPRRSTPAPLAPPASKRGAPPLPPVPRPTTLRPPPPPAPPTPRVPSLASLIADELARAEHDDENDIVDVTERDFIDASGDDRSTPVVDKENESSERGHTAERDLPGREVEQARSDRPPPRSSDELVAAGVPRWEAWRAHGWKAAAIAAGLAAVGINVGILIDATELAFGSTTSSATSASRASPSPTTATVTATATTATSASTTPPSAGATPAASAPLTSACTLAGTTRTLARRALLGGGLETAAESHRVAVGFVTGMREGRAIELDASTLAVLGTAKASGAPARRLVPLLPADESVDAQIDPSDAARTTLDAERGALAIRPASVWRTAFYASPTSPVEGLRAAPLASLRGFAVAFRRAGAIWIGAVDGDLAQHAYVPLTRMSDAGVKVGVPSVGVSGDTVIAAWAERASAKGAWAVKWRRWKPGLAPEATRTLVIPAGGLGEQAMAPSVAGLDGGRALLAWTEGRASSKHQVRAITIDENDRLVGDALTLSPDVANAGQGQIVLAENGHGVVAYFAARAGEFEVHATAVSCAR